MSASAIAIIQEQNDLGLRKLVQAIVRRYLDSEYVAPPAIERKMDLYGIECYYSDGSLDIDEDKTKTKTLFMNTDFLTKIDEFCRDVRKYAMLKTEEYLKS